MSRTKFTNKTYIGIDNGVSGSIGVVYLMPTGVPLFQHTPTFSCQNYTKAKKNITRIDVAALMSLLESIDIENCLAIVERPMVNPSRFQATQSALRSLEATLICLERLDIPYRFIDSKEWQRELLPEGIKGAPELKKASLDIGVRTFPQFKDTFKGDADGILIAEYARRRML